LFFFFVFNLFLICFFFFCLIWILRKLASFQWLGVLLCSFAILIVGFSFFFFFCF
jgi:hypothetical protein